MKKTKNKKEHDCPLTGIDKSRKYWFISFLGSSNQDLKRSIWTKYSKKIYEQITEKSVENNLF